MFSEMLEYIKSIYSSRGLKRASPGTGREDPGFGGATGVCPLGPGSLGSAGWVVSGVRASLCQLPQCRTGAMLMDSGLKKPIVVSWCWMLLVAGSQ